VVANVGPDVASEAEFREAEPTWPACPCPARKSGPRWALAGFASCNPWP